jgi:adenylate kinase family enzyme
MPPQRIVIVGCSGSEKSTLARELGRRLGLPVVHLDVLYYGPDWKKSSAADFRARVTAAHRGDAWISEGNFATWTFDIRLSRAEAIVALERPRWLCFLRVVWRAAMERRNRSDLPVGCSEQVDRDLVEFIWNYGRVGRPEIEAARLNYGPTVPVVRLSGDREIAAFLASPQFPPAVGDRYLPPCCWDAALSCCPTKAGSLDRGILRPVPRGFGPTRNKMDRGHRPALDRNSPRLCPRGRRLG